MGVVGGGGGWRVGGVRRRGAGRAGSGAVRGFLCGGTARCLPAMERIARPAHPEAAKLSDLQSATVVKNLILKHDNESRNLRYYKHLLFIILEYLDLSLFYIIWL